MDNCDHPAVARQRNADHILQCTLCGAVLEDPEFQLDPVFDVSQGGGGAARSARTGAGANRGTAAGSLRSLGGSLRPTRSVDGGLAPVGQSSRATIDQARREMMNIARSLEIDPVTVEIALGIFTSALRSHLVSGTRNVVLRACLYAACRRQKTTHIIYDFVEPNSDSAHAILTHMKLICEGTKTEVPVIDPSALIQRLAEQMDLGEVTADVVVCALKVLRAMRDDWIACGRRPMGVCAAALLVGCFVFNIPRTPEQVCGMARLTSNTITKRLNEFSATPAADLESIDDYQPSHATLPPAFNDSSRKSTEEDMGADMRELSSLYYELVAEAKVSTPATPERCRKWRRFLEKHCELEQQEPNVANLDLRNLTPTDQLRILGLSHTKPIPYEVVEESVKREEEKITMKVERGTSHSLAGELYNYAEGGVHGMHGVARAGAFPSEPLLDLDDPVQFEKARQRYRDLLEHNEEVRGLHADFDFDDDGVDGMPFALGAEGSDTHAQSQQQQQLGFIATQNSFGGSVDGAPSPSPSPATRWGGLDETSGHVQLMTAEERQEQAERDATRALLAEIMRDKDRRHALPWEFLVLQDAAEEDATDLLHYLVLDNEERVRREKIGLTMYKAEWDRGRPRTTAEIEQLEENRLAKRRRRQINEPQDVQSSLQQALRGRGAATVNTSNLADILPQLANEDDTAQDDDWDVQFDD